MGGISTSHSASLSNHKTSVSKGFDLRNWQGLTDLLRVGRESIPDPRAYAEFRNLVLGYAQQGGDAEIRKHIDAIVATFSQNKTKQEPTEKTLEIKQEVFTAKPEPVSHVQNKKKEDTEHETEAEPTPAETLQAKVNPRPPVAITTNRRMQPRFDIAPKQTFIPKEVTTVADLVSSEATIPSVSTISEISTDVGVAHEEENIPDEVSSEAPLKSDAEEKRQSPQTQDEFKARITEIKHIVHEKVGNPVALMGAHNVHGKRYMSALLSALKATSAGSLTEMSEALENLERVTKDLLEDAPLVSNEAQEVVMPVVDAPLPPVVEKTTVVPTPPEKQPMQEMVLPKVTPIHHAPTPEKVVETPVQNEEYKPTPKVYRETVEQQEEREVQEPIVLKEKGRVPLHKYSVSEILASKHTLQSTHSIHKEDDPPVVNAEERWNEDDTKAQRVTAPVLSENAHHPRTKHVYKAVSVSDPEVVKEVIGIDPQFISAEQSELFSPKITDALHQLLHEWTIFGGSGLFGIGPGGSEHPLYIKLSTLSMGEVLAGRWEKADPKLIKVIKQYVDAWRHEQGIAYTIDETFEHYLRRVVQKILKRQS